MATEESQAVPVAVAPDRHLAVGAHAGGTPVDGPALRDLERGAMGERHSFASLGGDPDSSSGPGGLDYGVAAQTGPVK